MSTPQQENPEKQEKQDDPSAKVEKKKQRSKNWSRQEILALIKVRSEFEAAFCNGGVGGGRKSQIWHEISQSLRRQNVWRDAQQCREKWEKLCSCYKLKSPSENPFFHALHPLLCKSLSFASSAAVNHHCSQNTDDDQRCANDDDDDEEATEDDLSPSESPPKRLKEEELEVEDVLRSVMEAQTEFFAGLLRSVEERRQLRHRQMCEREERWRSEERAQRCALTNALLLLSSKLLDVNQRQNDPLSMDCRKNEDNNNNSNNNKNGRRCKRSRNWKRGEVLRLIKLRGELDTKFVKWSRRSAVWDEVSELLCAEGILRDGKQCREKWDKLICEYREVLEQRKSQSDSPFFSEVAAVLGRRQHHDNKCHPLTGSTEVQCERSQQELNENHE
eukprot:TRINITY_DN35652_c0_g1_i1.p1 TRINITY_DN35652_c0_g1~~TRINITY_DN35652_c0_g1_i1.p1  ORF type:complete len:389 (-),score=34.22 TRINITY_DN35652_c0_g1_i1:7-1173(-)